MKLDYYDHALRAVLLALSVLFVVPHAGAQEKTMVTPAPNPRLTGKTYTERALACSKYFATAAPRSPTFPKDGMPFLAARLQLDVDTQGTLPALDRMLDATLKAKQDPFNLHAVMHAYLVHKDKFPPAMAAKVKRLAASWKYSKPIGVSLNYELMRDGSGWLAAQEWPDLVDAAGNDAATIQKNCAGWLWRIWRETTDRNASEYDAPIYYGTDFAPTRMHVFSPDFLSRWQATLPDTRTVYANHIWPSHKQIVRKMAWFTTGYGLASQRDDGSPFDYSLFKECRRTMLKWHSPQPASTFTIIQENRRRPSEKIHNAFAYGENPYCQTLQHEGTLIGVHDVPAEYSFWTTRAPFTTTGAIVKRIERDGWVLCHGGSMLFAFRFTEAATWDKPNTREKLDLLCCDAQRGGWILETSPLAPFAGGGTDAELAKFGDALLSKTKFTASTDASPPKLTFTNLRSHTLSLRWKPAEPMVKDECLVDGKPVRYDLFPLLKTTGANHPNGGMLSLESGGRMRRYDFKKWTITETAAPAPMPDEN